LANPYFAALCTGVSLELHEFRAMETAASSDDPLLWREFALELKTRLRKRAEEGDTIPLI
jgi:hypothetical protein